MYFIFCFCVFAYRNTIRITSSAIGIEIYAITARIKKYKSIIEKKQNKHDQVAFLAKSKLNSIIKNTVPWTYVISDLYDEEIVWLFYEK